MIDVDRKTTLDEFLLQMRGTLEVSEEVLARHVAKDDQATAAALMALREIQDSYAPLEQVDGMLKCRL